MSVAPASGACVKGSAFIASLRAAGFDFFTGVPCSLLEAPIAHLEQDRGLGYVPAVREDEAMGMAAGAWLAGKRLPVVFMQNSGLGNCLNAIASLQRIYDIPTLLVVSWRGKDGKDAPEHLVMGEAMPALFDSFGVPHERVALAGFDEQAKRLAKKLEETRQPVALVVGKGELV
jgi:phosphonopyruvate decarboxylase